MTERINNNSTRLEEQNDARFRAILETAVDAIIVINERGVIEIVNPAVEELFGYPLAELIGRNVFILMPSPHCESAR